MGTINLDISPCSYEMKKTIHFFKNIDWSDYKYKAYKGLVYMPDPETKEDYIQEPTYSN